MDVDHTAGSAETVSGPAAAKERPDYVITLVHGTWDVDSTFAKDSSFCRTLTSQLTGPTLIRSFKWTGRNRHRDRLTAADNLRTYLQDGLRDFPDAKHYLIAHSHGGNIAFYALRDSNLAARLSGIVTLSTPFIHVTRRQMPHQIRERIENVRPWHVVLLFAVAIYSSTFLPIVATLILLLLALITSLATLLMRFLISRSKSDLPSSYREFEHLLRLPTTAPENTLIVTSDSDEASGILTVGWFSSWVLTRLMAPLLVRLTAIRDCSPGIKLCLGIFFLVHGVLATILPWLHLPRSSHWLTAYLIYTLASRSIVLLIFTFISAFLFMTWTFSKLCWLFTLPFGADADLRAATLCCISAEATPPGGPWTVVNLSEALEPQYQPVVLNSAQKAGLSALIEEYDKSGEIRKTAWKSYRRELTKPYNWELAHSATHDKHHALRIVSDWISSRPIDHSSDD